MTQQLAQVGQEAVTVDKPDDGDLQLWSVTTIIGALDKPALLYWAAQQTADAAIDKAATWQAMLEDEGRNAAAKWLRDARFRAPRTILSAADLGTIAHKMCETYALTGSRPERAAIEHEVRLKDGGDLEVERETDTVEDMLDQFDNWLNRFTPSYQATEVAVYSSTFGYAGSADGFMTIDGTRFIFDYKTSRDTFDSRGQLKKPYPESVALQLAAYRYAEHAAVWRPRRLEKFRRRYYLLSPEERALAVPVPEVDTGLVIKLTPESCEAYPIRCDEDVHRAFLFVQESFRWVQETSRTVMRGPLQ
jgi:ATP-dependent exoDNAse (exonuclease V) beta subunit